jgi:hypothetical protein
MTTCSVSGSTLTLGPMATLAVTGNALNILFGPITNPSSSLTTSSLTLISYT